MPRLMTETQKLTQIVLPNGTVVDSDKIYHRVSRNRSRVVRVTTTTTRHAPDALGCIYTIEQIAIAVTPDILLAWMGEFRGTISGDGLTFTRITEI